MQEVANMCKTYTGNKKRVCDFIKKKRVVRTSEIVLGLQIDARKVWEITDELEKDGIIFTT